MDISSSENGIAYERDEWPNGEKPTCSSLTEYRGAYWERVVTKTVTSIDIPRLHPTLDKFHFLILGYKQTGILDDGLLASCQRDAINDLLDWGRDLTMQVGPDSRLPYPSSIYETLGEVYSDPFCTNIEPLIQILEEDLPTAWASADTAEIDDCLQCIDWALVRAEHLVRHCLMINPKLNLKYFREE